MQATERHPDVPFLAELDSNKGPASSSSHDLPRETTAGSNRPSSARASQPPLTPSTPVGAPITRFEATPSEVSSEVQGQAAVEVPAEPIPPAWPKVGQGCLAGMDIKEDDLQDKNDFEAFSLTSYNAAGRKIRENGVAISTPVKAIILKRCKSSTWMGFCSDRAFPLTTRPAVA